MAARQQLPRGMRQSDRRPARHAGDAARAGLAEALTALYGPVTGITHEQALAERAQWDAEDEAKRHAQACLPLEVRR